MRGEKCFTDAVYNFENAITNFVVRYSTHTKFELIIQPTGENYFWEILDKKDKFFAFKCKKEKTLKNFIIKCFTINNFINRNIKIFNK